MPSKKKSCDRVRQGIAGPAPDHILDAIRAEYWLPAGTPVPRESSKDEAQPKKSKQPPKTNPKVKP